MLAGKCAMCLEDKTLIESHLMSAGLYALCHAPDSDPVMVSKAVMMRTGRELKYPLLCSDCDGSLSVKGENWILPLLARMESDFPLCEMLTKFPPDAKDNGSALYATVNNPKIRGEDITHFAMGIFWKAAVHSWRGSKSEPMIDLGRYGEPVRRFLRGESKFPEKMALTVGVSPPPVQAVTFVEPYRGSTRNIHTFIFNVPGVQFMLSVGNQVSEEVKRLSFAPGSAHVVVVTDLNGTIFSRIRAATAGAKIAQNLQKYMKESNEYAGYVQRRKEKK